MYQSTQRNIQEDLNRQQHRCENLKSRIKFLVLLEHSKTQIALIVK